MHMNNSTFSRTSNRSLPGPFFQTPFMAVSSVASTAQYPVHLQGLFTANLVHVRSLNPVFTVHLVQM